MRILKIVANYCNFVRCQPHYTLRLYFVQGRVRGALHLLSLSQGEITHTKSAAFHSGQATLVFALSLLLEQA